MIESQVFKENLLVRKQWLSQDSYFVYPIDKSEKYGLPVGIQGAIFCVIFYI